MRIELGGIGLMLSFKMHKYLQFSVGNIVLFAAVLLAFASCHPCGNAKIQDVELQVDALQIRLFAWSASHNFYAFFGPSDTLSLDSIVEWYIQIIATGQQIAMPPTAACGMFPKALACDPVPPRVFTKQNAKGIQVFTSAALNAQFPAGSNITALFFTSPRPNEGWPLQTEITQHGLGRLMDTRNPLSFFLRNSPNSGAISRFTFELYLDDDTLRSVTPFVRF
jgi:hypothetical protein